MCLFSHEHDDSKEIKLLIAILKELKEIHMALIDDVVTAVAANTDATKAVVAEVAALEATIAAGGTPVDPVVLQGVLDQVNANTAALVAAATPSSTPASSLAAPVYGKGQK